MGGLLGYGVGDGEDGQVHADDQSTNDNTQENDHDGLNEGGQAGLVHILLGLAERQLGNDVLLIPRRTADHDLHLLVEESRFSTTRPRGY